MKIGIKNMNQSLGLTQNIWLENDKCPPCDCLFKKS
jgi:hypothetical protein